LLSRPTLHPFRPAPPLCPPYQSTNGDNLPEVPREEAEASKLTRVNFSGGSIEFTWHTSISEISAENWDNCLGTGSATETKSDCNFTTDVQEEPWRSPFLEHSWLHTLEESGCVSSDTGWNPRHLTMQVHCERVPLPRDERVSEDISNEPQFVDGCIPAYIKTHSRGEFIFDKAWADAAFRNGLDYYPKLLLGVPFTPVTGSRILWHSRIWDTFSQEEMGELTKVVGEFLKQNIKDGIALEGKGICSGVHINFCTDTEATAIAGPLNTAPISFDEIKKKGGSISVVDEEMKVEADKQQDSFEAMLQQLERNNRDDFSRRVSIQYQWNNRNPLRKGQPFDDFAEYLKCFRSKRRIAIKRERTKVREIDNIRIEAISGADILKIEGLVERMFEIYVSTVDKMFWGRQYLTLEFFQRLCQTSFINNLCFMCARRVSEKDSKKLTGLLSFRAKDVFAGTFNVVKNGVFFGRYWGCLPEYNVKNLHFEVCYWSAIEYCIQNGLRRMEPGAGGGGTYRLLLFQHEFLSFYNILSGAQYLIPFSTDYKWARGFDPHFVHSVHFFADPWLRRAVRQFLESETEYNFAVRQHLLERSSVADNSVRE